MNERIISWRDVYGNKYRFGLHPLMLTDEGYRLKTVTKIRGESKKTACAVTIVFTTQYVIAYLAGIISKLSIYDKKQLQKLINDALNEAKNQNAEIHK